MKVEDKTPKVNQAFRRARDSVVLRSLRTSGGSGRGRSRLPMIAPPSLAFLKVGSVGVVATTLVHIDDDFAWDETLRKSVSALPSAVSMRVVEACTRAHGLRLCRELSPSIIVMELWLQGEDGFELLEQLAALPCKPRVLALTRRCDPVAMHRAREGRLAGWSANGVTH